MSSYADSSFVVPLYLSERHSTTAAAHVSQAVSVMISPLVVVETTNALQLRGFRRQATTSETSAAIRTFNADIAAGFLSAVAMPTNIWKIGEDLALSHSATLGTRSLDILQVAAALALKCDSFLTFDQNQARLARAAGLLTPIQPE